MSEAERRIALAAALGPLPALRHVNGEAIVLVAGGRALLMQLAHPRVAAGVAAHSSFQRDRLGRLLRTLRPMYAIAFGTPEEAAAAAARIDRRHLPVAGSGYRADDADLKLWVYATLIDSALLAYRRFVRPLTPALEAAYYEDASRVGALLGVPADCMPRDVPAFRRYIEGTSGGLDVSPAARSLAAQVFAAPSPGLAPAFALLRCVSAGLLPEVMRRNFGFEWNAPGRVALGAAELCSRAVWPRLPPRLRRVPTLLMPPSVARARSR